MIKTFWLTENSDLSAVNEIRRKVFIDEFGLDENFFGPDTDANILLICDGSRPAATGRVVPLGESYLLGQIATLPEHRGCGYGDLLIRMLIRKAFESGAEVQYVNALPDAVKFYEKLGFLPTGKKHGIQLEMKHTGDVHGKCQ